jgi:hypothetical protein
MHGGFENETPNIPTNSIMKLDLLAHVKNNAQLVQKIESAFQNKSSSSTKSTEGQGSNSNSSRASTPPMQSLAKSNMKIRMGHGEIEQKKG